MDKRASLLQWFAATAEAKLKAVQDYLRLDFRKKLPIVHYIGRFSIFGHKGPLELRQEVSGVLPSSNHAEGNIYFRDEQNEGK